MQNKSICQFLGISVKEDHPCTITHEGVDVYTETSVGQITKTFQGKDTLEGNTVCEYLGIKVEKDKPFRLQNEGRTVYVEDHEGHWSILR